MLVTPFNANFLFLQEMCSTISNFVEKDITVQIVYFQSTKFIQKCYSKQSFTN